MSDCAGFSQIRSHIIYPSAYCILLNYEAAINMEVISWYIQSTSRNFISLHFSDNKRDIQIISCYPAYNYQKIHEFAVDN